MSDEQEQEQGQEQPTAAAPAVHVCAFCPGTEPVEPTMFASGGGQHWWRCPDCGSLNSYTLPPASVQGESEQS